MRTAGHITGVTVDMVTASPLTATGTPTTAIPAATATPTTAIPVAMATPTLATVIPVATATATVTKGIATAANKGTTATTKGIATATTKGTTATAKGIATAATKGTAIAETEGTATAITGYRKSKRYRGDAANKWRLVVDAGRHGHCAIYEDKLQRIWPREEENRKAKIAQFAKENGLRLSVYKRGLYAIFETEY